MYSPQGVIHRKCILEGLMPLWYVFASVDMVTNVTHVL